MQDAHVRAHVCSAWRFSFLRSSFLALLCIASLLLGSHSAQAGVSYTYDDLGRITQALYTDGTVVQYLYDANGNIVATYHLQASTLSVSSFSPTFGQAGTVVTVSGSGFSTNPVDNAVTVGGVSAVVSSASQTQLVITVPLGAQTGPIAVTVAGNTATSAQQMVVRHPVITSFSPSIVNVGTAVTITGGNLALAPPTATITAGGVSATVTSVTNTQAVFSAPTGGTGVIQLSTSYGQATSSAPLYVMPAGVPAANVQSIVNATAGGSIAAVNIPANKLGVLSFDATQGQFISVQVSSLVASPGNASASFTLYAPSGSPVTSGSISAGSPSVHLPRMATTGRYLLVVNPGTASFQFNAVIELNSVLSGTGAALTGVATTANGQSKRIIVLVSAAQHVGIGLTHLTMSGVGSITLNLYQPNGSPVWGRPCYTSDPVSSCGLSTTDLPVATGEYQLMAVPNGSATMSFDLTITPPITGTLASGTPVSVNMAQPGQMAIYTFTATQGQSMTLRLGSIATTPANVNMYMSFQAPNGSIITNQTTSTGVTLNYQNIVTGTPVNEIAQLDTGSYV